MPEIKHYLIDSERLALLAEATRNATDKNQLLDIDEIILAIKSIGILSPIYFTIDNII